MNTNAEVILGLGIFDGMHLGHQQIAKRCTHLVTFDPHPDIVLSKNPDLKHLTTAEELDQFGYAITRLPFDLAMAKLTPEAFLETQILTRFSIKKIVIGYDFTFGYMRQGNAEFLRSWGDPKGIEIQVIPPYTINDQIVSSSMIRELIASAKLKEAQTYLGHSYLFRSNVIHGEGRGKKLNFPTANMAIPSHKLLPPDGVYIGKVECHEQCQRPALINIGMRPTFGDNVRSVEVHIPQYEGNLYGQSLNVWITSYLRAEKKFESIIDLQNQIQNDIESLYQGMV
jgi:riboflavin kinase/FMN adenylyltransferase